MALGVPYKRLHPQAKTPAYMTAGAAGLDVYAQLDAPMTLKPLGRALVPTGIALAIPEGHEIQVRPRSGLALKHGLTCLNTPGTIDSDYRGEVKVLLVNLSDTAYTIEPGERIAQLVCAQVVKISLTEAESLDDTSRQGGGFGHTGR